MCALALSARISMRGKTRRETRTKAKELCTAEKKRKPVHFSPKRSKPVQFCYPHFVRKRLIPQIRVRMQANDDNEDEDGAVEGLVDLGLANLYQGAII